MILADSNKLFVGKLDFSNKLFVGICPNHQNGLALRK